ncbi:hypothetical protein OHA40_09365 [Nocardia sp. NBC_00508]|uniref:hypothetical protein n=1 Tax=Nocardia sp. NBC_00508 TaxID=2975992 RepID=UPI002E808554|nr:hypothetical protein [Nocardia sp. NBC_00508]WUD68296.1 hypothetical protein OHA40_09365 [Nocardia sp. NBC_00508]
MDAVVKEVAEEGKRLIDRAWLGELSRDQAVHMFVQVGDGMVRYETALTIIDDGVRRLNVNARRLRILRWCTLLEIPIFSAFAGLAVLFGDYTTAGLSVLFLLILQVTHRTMLPSPPSVLRQPK